MGLTSDDEDYIDPTAEEIISAESVSEEPGGENKESSSSSNNKLDELDISKFKKVKKSSIVKEETPLLSEHIPTDMTDSDS